MLDRLSDILGVIHYVFCVYVPYTHDTIWTDASIEEFFRLIKNFYSDFLVGFFIQFLLILTKKKSEQDDMNSHLDKIFPIKPQKLHRSFALQLKKVYISDKGEIENIEFEGYPWFLFQYFKKSIPEYQPKIKEGFIRNKKNFHRLITIQSWKNLCETI